MKPELFFLLLTAIYAAPLIGRRTSFFSRLSKLFSCHIILDLLTKAPQWRFFHSPLQSTPCLASKPKSGLP